MFKKLPFYSGNNMYFCVLFIGSLFVNGVCASCTSCDTYLTADPDSNTPRQYLFWQAEGAVS